MTNSQKLSILQLMLSFLHVCMYIFLIYKLNSLSPLTIYDNSLTFFLVIVIITGMIIFVTGIVQIIYKLTEQTSRIYLVAGIFGILIIIPLSIFLIVILNIIGISEFENWEFLISEKKASEDDQEINQNRSGNL